jgi:hypothetical protein
VAGFCTSSTWMSKNTAFRAGHPSETRLDNAISNCGHISKIALFCQVAHVKYDLPPCKLWGKAHVFFQTGDTLLQLVTSTSSTSAFDGRLATSILVSAKMSLRQIQPIRRGYRSPPTIDYVASFKSSSVENTPIHRLGSGK